MVITRIGDFQTDESMLEDAKELHEERPKKERVADEAKRAPITTSFLRYKRNPGELDFPGVDTPTDEPNLLPKDIKRGSGGSPKNVIGQPDEYASVVASAIPDEPTDERSMALAPNEEEITDDFGLDPRALDETPPDMRF